MISNLLNQKRLPNHCVTVKPFVIISDSYDFSPVESEKITELLFKIKFIIN